MKDSTKKINPGFYWVPGKAGVILAEYDENNELQIQGIRGGIGSESIMSKAKYIEPEKVKDIMASIKNEHEHAMTNHQRRHDHTMGVFQGGLERLGVLTKLKK